MSLAKCVARSNRIPVRRQLKRNQMEKNKDQYIGPSKVFGLQKEDYKTPLGGDVVKVLFENDRPLIMPLRTFNLLVTDAPQPLDIVQDKKIDTIVGALVEMVMEYDMTNLEGNRVIAQFAQTLKNITNRGAHLAMTKEIFGQADVAGWVKGADFSENRTLLEAHSISLKLGNATTKQETAGEEAGNK